MRYPPALVHKPGVSRVYRLEAWAIAIFLIALCAVSVDVNELFTLKNTLYGALTVLASLLILRDAYFSEQGSLHFAQGEWFWQHGEEKMRGTCTLHLDLQSYMLVRFAAHSAENKSFLRTTHWFHLEARHADHTGTSSVWLALRRAIACPTRSSNETNAA